MQKKFVLGILFFALLFSGILIGFSDFIVDNRDYREEPVYSLEPTQPEAESSEPEPTEAEPTEVETTPEPEPTEAEANPEPEAPEIEQTEEEPTPEPETTETEPTPEPTETETPETEPTETDPTPPTPPVQKNYSAPVMNAINFFRTTTEPEAMLWFDVMHRRFGIDEFTNALEQFDQMLWWFPEKSYVRLFRRMADYDARISAHDLEKVTNELDLFTLPALYCDRLELPSNYSALLQEGVSNGGYQLTHVLLAWVWIQENGVELALPDGFIDDMYRANAALINTDSTVTDVEMEAAAFLCLAGQSELIDSSFVDCVIASQAVDGSWGGTNARWHTTVLGLLFLLHMEFPSDSYPPVLAPSSA
jgi:hypothetical protein